MTRENAAAKAKRYLSEGRLTVTQVQGDRIEATCRGDGRFYRLGWHGTWHCDCPAVTDRCCHLTALRLVTVVETAGRRRPRRPTEVAA